jgi:hypothetical protein
MAKCHKQMLIITINQILKKKIKVKVKVMVKIKVKIKVYALAKALDLPSERARPTNNLGAEPKQVIKINIIYNLTLLI